MEKQDVGDAQHRAETSLWVGHHQWEGVLVKKSAPSSQSINFLRPANNRGKYTYITWFIITYIFFTIFLITLRIFLSTFTFLILRYGFSFKLILKQFFSLFFRDTDDNRYFSHPVSTLYRFEKPTFSPAATYLLTFIICIGNCVLFFERIKNVAKKCSSLSLPKITKSSEECCKTAYNYIRLILFELKFRFIEIQTLRRVKYF